MPTTPKTSVRLYPLAGAYLPDVPAIVQDVDPAEAERILSFHPPAFSTSPPAEPAPSIGPADAGPSDSVEEI